MLVHKRQAVEKGAVQPDCIGSVFGLQLSLLRFFSGVKGLLLYHRLVILCHELFPLLYIFPSISFTFCTAIYAWVYCDFRMITLGTCFLMFLVCSVGSCVTRPLGQSTWEASDSSELPRIAWGIYSSPISVCTVQQWARRATALLRLGRPGSECHYCH